MRRASATRAFSRTIPFKAIVAPRPIGWISTRSPDGRINLAPYSFFNAFSSVPPIVGFSSEGWKDSATFARESGEFVANLASLDLLQANERDLRALAARRQRIRRGRPAMAPCRLVSRAARRASPCGDGMQGRRRRELKSLARRDAGIISCSARSSRFHIDDAFIKNGRFDTAAAKPLARCGYQDYAAVEALFTLARPPGGEGRGAS